MSLLRKSMTLALGEGAARVLAVVIYVVIARSLGVADFGVFSFAMATALVAAVVFDMGQGSHMGRTLSRRGPEYAHIYTRVTVNKFVAGLGLAAAAYPVMSLLGFELRSIYATILMIGWAVFLSAVEGMRAVMRAFGRMRVDSILNASESAGRLLAVVLAASLGAGVLGFCLAFLIEAVIAAAVSLAVLSRRLHFVPTREQWATTVGFRREAVALGLVSIASAGFYRIDQVFVLPLAGDAASGLYGAAARVAFTATVVAGLVTSAAYPSLAAARDQPEAFGDQLRRTLGLAVGSAAGVSAVIMLFANEILSVLFGAEYLEATVVLRVLAVVVLFNAVTVVSMFSASALHRERQVLPRVLALLLLTALANLLLIPRYGVLACAWISAIGEVLLAASVVWLSRDRLFVGVTGKTE